MRNTNRTKAQLLEELQQLHSELVVVRSIVESRTHDLYISEERFSLAMRSTNDGLWDWNLETNEVYYSPRWKAMLGYDENELENNLDTWANLVHPEDRKIALQQTQEYITGNRNSFEIEFRMRHKNGREMFILSRGLLVKREIDAKPIRMVGTHVDITERKKADAFDRRHAEILEMIALGRPAPDIYDAIALMYEGRHPGLRCSMLELSGNKLLHGGAPSLPKEYCAAVHGLENGPSVGSCGTSTFTGQRVLVENIETDPKWEKIKHVALPHGMRCCWSEPIKSSDGKILGAFGMYYNHPALPDEKELQDLISAAQLTGIVMERDHVQKRIHTMAYRDELTGLASRAAFTQHLEEITKTSLRHDRRFGLLYIDLDDFKSVNDSLGHDAGDLLLKIVAERLITTCRGTDFIARLGGDEFCILIEEVEEDYAANVAKRCLEAVHKPLEICTRKLTPTCSIGIAYYPEDGSSLSSLLKAADISLYSAKGNGKSRYAFYKTELTQKAEYRFQLEQSLREAIGKQQLSLVYQPQINIQSGKILGVEALSRWNHSELGQIPPQDFIATAERIGMISQLTEWVLRTACTQLIAWKQQGFYPLRLAVNISPSIFLDEKFVLLIKRIIRDTQIIPAELELEVTESVVQTDPRNLSIFSKLKKLGVLLSIDDFGTGYSSFASLKHLKADYLKIDKYFIDDMLVDQKSLTLVSSMIEMGQKLGYGIVAEGVETTKQLDIIKKLGCDIVQGYIFSKPVDAESIVKLLKLETRKETWQSSTAQAS